jgi:hypothetical protein
MRADMAATKTLTGTYEGSDTPLLKRGDAIEVIHFERDNAGTACVWIVANERLHSVYATDVRIK